jgi:hypothetical protein
MSGTETYKCQCCGESFVARVADRKRGWARFCSKSCKAIKHVSRSRRWQRFDKCRTKEDMVDLARNPRMIEPLYDGWGERAGEVFYAGGEGWDDHKF